VIVVSGSCEDGVDEDETAVNTGAVDSVVAGIVMVIDVTALELPVVAENVDVDVDVAVTHVALTPDSPQLPTAVPVEPPAELKASVAILIVPSSNPSPYVIPNVTDSFGVISGIVAVYESEA